MKVISSTHNEQIKSVVALHLPKGRLQQQRFIAQGFITCSTLVQAGMQVQELYVTQELQREAFKLAPEPLIALVDDHVMNKISTVTTPSGLVAVFALPENPSPELLGPGLVLANITDPGNMGTLIRTAVAMNVQSIVIVDGVDPWSPKVVQASAGTIGRANLFVWPWDTLVRNKKDLTLCALVVSGGENPHTVATQKALLVVGNEAHGLTAQQCADCDTQITIPMPGNTESLNAAVAGSIALYLAFGSTR